jgi:hypothetical protein
MSNNSVKIPTLIWGVTTAQTTRYNGRIYPEKIFEEQMKIYEYMVKIKTMISLCNEKLEKDKENQ